MNGKEFITTQMRIIEIAKIADSLDLKAFLQCIANAENMGAVMDPDAFIKASQNLAAIKKLAETVVPVKDVFEMTFKPIMQNQVLSFKK